MWAFGLSNDAVGHDGPAWELVKHPANRRSASQQGTPVRRHHAASSTRCLHVVVRSRAFWTVQGGWARSWRKLHFFGPGREGGLFNRHFGCSHDAMLAFCSSCEPGLHDSYY